jgi:hypothetical protein
MIDPVESARRAAAAAGAAVRWLSEEAVDFAPHLLARDLATLRAHHHGLSGDALAKALIDTAARASGAVGAVGGVVSSMDFAAPPLLLATPVEIVAETVAVVAIEVKLVAELHEVYGRPAVGTPAVRLAAYLGAWTRRRALSPVPKGVGLTGVVTGTARRELRRRLVRRAGDNAATILPFMAGAAAGASLNSRETQRLGERIAKDLGARHL